MRDWSSLPFILLMVAVGGAVTSARGEDQPPAWAYPVNPPDFKPSPDNGKMLQVPGSTVSYTISQTRNLFLAPDWYPGEHPPLPGIVADGRKPSVFACGFCHRVNGSGGPENASLAGLPIAYIVEQIADFKTGARQSSVPNRAPPKLMTTASKNVTEPEVQAAAQYFSALKPAANISVIETDSVPKTRVAGWFLADAGNGEKEPIAGRIIEVPEDLSLFEDRDAHARFLAYVPVGSVEKGKALAAGGNGKTIQCEICHGPELKGLGNIPAIAGRSPSYLMRQLYDFKDGARAGVNSALMKTVVEKLATEDMTALVAYAASLPR